MKRFTRLMIIAAVLAVPMLATPLASLAQVSVGISVSFGPPPLPYYPQPYAPGPGYIWTPGYWGYGPYGYYWVPGTWVIAPAIGLLWTPGWWGWDDGFYSWHRGYWGPQVGFYGGINYGYGYTGRGYEGGYWRGRDFYYNSAVNNVNPAYARYAYDRPVSYHGEASRVSYNGGEGGIRFQPTPEQMAYARQQHTYATPAQIQAQRLAKENPAQRFSMNHGRPEIAATARPGKFNGPDVVRMNKARNSYDYKPGKQKITGSRVGSPLPQKSWPVEGPRRPGQTMNRNENRGGAGPGVQVENPYVRQPELRRQRPNAYPESRRPPPRNTKEDDHRPPPR